jgi:hypothetical protein
MGIKLYLCGICKPFHAYRIYLIQRTYTFLNTDVLSHSFEETRLCEFSIILSVHYGYNHLYTTKMHTDYTNIQIIYIHEIS